MKLKRKLQSICLRRWKALEKEGDTEQANIYKNEYRKLTLELLEKPYRQFEEKLKPYPTIMLN